MHDPGPPPPIYSQQDPDHVGVLLSDGQSSNTGQAQGIEDPQIIIIPTVDALNFQKGFLGADGERAAVEGELQIKGIDPSRYHRVYARHTMLDFLTETYLIRRSISLRSVESVHGQEDIELSNFEADLFSQSSSDASSLPASLLFSIPLPPDTPQSFETPYSSLRHVLSATLHATDPSLNICRSLQVHTKRFSSHGLSIPIYPETRSSSEPTLVKVEVPRTQFTAGEAVPIYVTIPPPAHALVEAGLRLRNVRAELVQSIRTNVSEHDKAIGTAPLEGSSSQALSAALPSTSSSSKAPISPVVGPEHISTVARSGAQCRFSASRAVQLRFLLQQSSPDSSPVNYPVDLPGGGTGSHGDSESISQETLLHSISFSILVHVSFVEPSSRRERVSTITIPINILPTPAPLPEVAPSMDIAYQKKHDQPPTRTVRQDDIDAPVYSEGEAGPSAASGFGAPPPFEERDAPPSFFEASSSSYMEASSSSRLPTFQEAESEIIVPPPDTPLPLGRASQADAILSGEGVHFGFTISEQYDGHSDSDMQRNTTPPPTLEMARLDTDVTPLAGMAEPERTIEAMGIALEQQHQQHQRSQSQGEAPPPPPPAMDDPSDPPPSIDSDFRASTTIRQPRPVNPSVRYSSPPPELPARTTAAQERSQGSTADQNAPPPYLVPESHQHASGPPPYVG